MQSSAFFKKYIYSFNPRRCISQKVEIGIPVLSKGMLASGTHVMCACACVYMCVYTQTLSRVRLFATLWTLVHQAPLSMGFPRQEYWSGLLISSFRGSSQPRNRTHISCIAGRFFTAEPSGKPLPLLDTVLSPQSPCCNGD